MGMSRFFYFLAGSSEQVINDCPEAERNYHMAIGGFVLITAIAASLSGGYALYTIFQSVPMAILFGLFWGITIGAIDRFVVMTMDLTVGGSWFRTMLAACARLVIAVFIAFVVARPLELRIFAPEIGEHLKQGLLARTAETTDRLQAELTERQAAYEGNARLAEAKVGHAALLKDHQACLAEQAVLREATHGECDGTLGTMRVGVGPICELKRKDLEEIKARCTAIEGRVVGAEQLIAKIVEDNDRVFAEMRTETERQIAAVQAEAAAKIEQIELGNAGSLLTRLEALHELAKTSNGMWWTLVFVTALFMLMEALPVGLKLMVSGRGSYPIRIVADEAESTKRHRIERKYRERERIKHRSTIYGITDAVREAARNKALETLARGNELVANDVNLEIRRRTEVASQEFTEPRMVFPQHVPVEREEEEMLEEPLGHPNEGVGVVRRRG